MSSQPSSSKEAMSTNSQPPPQSQPPDRLERDLRGGKVIFFTLDTLFDRDFANKGGLERCKRLCPKLRGKSMDELQRAYRDAMASAYLNHIHANITGAGSQSSVDKVEIMFRKLNLDPPSMNDKSIIGREFPAGFNRNRFEVFGASRTLAQLKNLEYTIVVADDDLMWDAVEDLNFWRYVDANIITKDPVMRKPDRRVFKNALDACGVSPKNAVIVGCSIEKDIAGIINAEAEPILYMPNYNSMEMDVQGTRVLVVRSMPELLSKICRRPENRHLLWAQRHQMPPPSPPPMPHASQARGYTNDQNDGSSSQHHYPGSSQSQCPASDPKPIDDRHAIQSWGEAPLSLILSHPGSSKETPRRLSLPDPGHPTKHYERTARPVPTLSCTPSKRPYEARSEHGYVPSLSYHEQGYPDHDPTRGHHNPAARSKPGQSTESSSPDAPQLTGQLKGANGDGGGSGKTSTGGSTPVYTPPSPLPTPLPSMRMFPPTEDYGITRATYGENRDQRRFRDDEHEHYSTHGGYTTLPPLRSWYQPPIQSHSTYRGSISGGGHGNENETSGSRYPTQDGYPTRTPVPFQDAWHQGQYQSSNSGQHCEVQGRSYPAQHPHQAGTPAPHHTPSGMYGEHGRHTFARRTTTMYAGSAHRPRETHSARRLSGNWESPGQRGYPRREGLRVQPYHGEVFGLTSPTMNGVPSSQAPLSTAQDPVIPGVPSHRPNHGDSNSSPDRWSSMLDTGSSPDPVTPPSSSPEAARPDGVDAERLRQWRRRTEELRGIAQAAMDLSRDHSLPPL